MRSIHDELETTRKPRIHIKYEVETESGKVEKELPFVIGVMGDFSGNDPGHTPKSLKERKFININKDNFDQVMNNINPGLAFRAPNTLKNDKSEINVNLKFNALSDFEPAALVEQIPALKKLKQTRDKLRDLLSKTDRSDELEQLLEATLQDPSQIEQLSLELKETSKETL